MCAPEIGKNIGLLGAASNQADQKSGQTFKENGLTDDQQNRQSGVEISMMNFELEQPLSQEMEHQEKVGDDKERVDYELNRKSAHSLDGFLFHQKRLMRYLLTCQRHLAVACNRVEAQIVCAGRVSF
jgi:hypothetical protein